MNLQIYFFLWAFVGLVAFLEWSYLHAQCTSFVVSVRYRNIPVSVYMSVFSFSPGCHLVVVKAS